MLKKVIYIIGHQRSGTTLLSMLVGNHPDVYSVGELRLLNQYINREKGVCLCGDHLSECGFWNGVARSAGIKLDTDPTAISFNRLQLLLMSILPLTMVRSLLSFIGYGWRETLDNVFNLYDAVSEETGSEFIVDSSKDPVTAKLLYMLRPDLVKILYIHRDGRGVVSSLHKRRVSTKDAARTWRNTANKIRMLNGNLPDDVVYRISYEDLCSDVAGVMNDVCAFSGLSTEADLAVIDKVNKHDIAGSPSITNNPSPRIDVSLDTSWKGKLSDEDVSTFEKIAGTANRRLGYE